MTRSDYERLAHFRYRLRRFLRFSEAAGLVERYASRDDKREVQVTLTREGSRCLAKLACLHRAELRSARVELAVPGLDGRCRHAPGVPASHTPGR